MSLGRATPILRIFDEAKAKEFYVGFLGFKVDWEHRPGIQAQPWGNDMSVADPFGNRLIFTDVKSP